MNILHNIMVCSWISWQKTESKYDSVRLSLVREEDHRTLCRLHQKFCCGSSSLRSINGLYKDMTQVSSYAGYNKFFAIILYGSNIG